MSTQKSVISKRSSLFTNENDLLMNEERHDVLQKNVSNNTDDKNNEHDTTDVV